MKTILMVLVMMVSVDVIAVEESAELLKARQAAMELGETLKSQLIGEFNNSVNKFGNGVFGVVFVVAAAGARVAFVQLLYFL